MKSKKLRYALGSALRLPKNVQMQRLSKRKLRKWLQSKSLKVEQESVAYNNERIAALCEAGLAAERQRDEAENAVQELRREMAHQEEMALRKRDEEVSIAHQQAQALEFRV